jgi:putative dimethyl sulfoxide reductase chaperone
MSVLYLQAAGRSALYWLLAELFLTCPDATLVERLRRELSDGGDTSGAPAAALHALADALPTNADDTEALAVEYTRLFGAVSRDYGPPPPYESMHRRDSEDQDATAVEAFYAKAGLAAFEPAAPPDHLGVELRFMALLCHEEAGRRCNGDVSGAKRARITQAAFLNCHLLTWAPEYLALIKAEAHVPFYSELSRAALSFLHEADLALEEEN